jgi:hypothetical protein
VLRELGPPRGDLGCLVAEGADAGQVGDRRRREGGSGEVVLRGQAFALRFAHLYTHKSIYTFDKNKNNDLATGSFTIRSS